MNQLKVTYASLSCQLYASDSQIYFLFSTTAITIFPECKMSSGSKLREEGSQDYKSASGKKKKTHKELAKKMDNWMEVLANFRET